MRFHDINLLCTSREFHDGGPNTEAVECQRAGSPPLRMVESRLTGRECPEFAPQSVDDGHYTAGTIHCDQIPVA